MPTKKKYYTEFTRNDNSIIAGFSETQKQAAARLTRTMKTGQFKSGRILEDKTLSGRI